MNVFISPEGITHQEKRLLWSDIARIHIQQTNTSSFTLGMLNMTINQRGFVHTSFSITITPHKGAPWHVVAKKDPTESLYQMCPEAQNIIDKSVKEETQLL